MYCLQTQGDIHIMTICHNSSRSIIVDQNKDLAVWVQVLTSSSCFILELK